MSTKHNGSGGQPPVLSDADSDSDSTTDQQSSEDSQDDHEASPANSHAEIQEQEAEQPKNSLLAFSARGGSKFDPKNEQHLRMLLQATSTEHQIRGLLDQKEYYSEEQKKAIVKGSLEKMIDFGVLDPEVLAFGSEAYESHRNAASKFLGTLIETVSGDIVDTSALDHGDRGFRLESASSFQIQTPRMGLEGTEFPGLGGSAVYGPRWQEMECLGKGGFGSVWACKNLLDGEIYAVKKIIITDQFLNVARITDEAAREKAFGELHHEVKVLARLDHPNIVRYFNSWMEKMTHDQFEQNNKHLCPEGLSQYSEAYSESVDSSEGENSGGAGNIEEEEEEPEEYSREFSSNSGVSDASLSLSKDIKSLSLTGNGKSAASATDINYFDHSANLSNHSNGSDTSDLQLIPRSDLPSFGMISARPKQSHVHILSIQMAKYALSLSDFIKTPSDSPKDLADFGFDYHFQPRIAVELLLKIADGVEYMHHYELVHRDLKPANVFLKVEPGAIGDMQGSVRVSGCKCSHRGHKCGKTGGCLPGSLCWVTPKIGDFGLTADIKRKFDRTSDKALQKSLEGQGVAGTLLYTPPKWAERVLQEGKSGKQPERKERSDVHLADAYALGIIFFELLQQFSTSYQRHIEISKLREDSRSDDPFPSDFCRRYETTLDENIIPAIKSIILRLTCQKHLRLSIPELKEELIGILIIGID
ncbi:hypothetical protein ABW19_dt0209025 [Dactylella cylindrospora]|nr:hypothetical protein ABW19_dt0209025 [Dactylella cylindrospora]